jgi:hypothetical protein
VGGGSFVSLDVDGVGEIGYDSSHGNFAEHCWGCV